MEYKRRQGVGYGPERTSATHPHYVDWRELDNESQNQDRFIASAILRDWIRGALSLSDLRAAIHNAWAEWSILQGENHPHALPFHQAHGADPGEHAIQEELIQPLLTNDLRLHSPLTTRRTCIVLLPLRDHTKAVCDEILEPAIKDAGYEPIRADHLRGSQSIHEDVVDQIEQSSAVIADLTDDNPNVNYEIGLARSLGRPIIMIAQERPRDKVPFYYKGQRIQFYDRDKPGWQEELRTEVQRALTHAVRTDPLSENQSLGLTGFFGKDNDAFEHALTRDIGRTSQRFVAVGLGLAFLNAQRRGLMEALRNQVIKEPNLNIHIILPRKDHPGLLARIKEEAEYQPDIGIIPEWPSTHFKFAMELPQGLEGFPRERVRVKRLPYLPTAMTIQLDNVFYFRCYGPPLKGGWACPWLRCDKTIASEAWNNFLENTISEAVKHCVDDGSKGEQQNHGK